MMDTDRDITHDSVCIQNQNTILCKFYSDAEFNAQTGKVTDWMVGEASGQK